MENIFVRFSYILERNTTEKDDETMTQSKRQQERQWNVRKQSQNPSHGKVKSFEELAEEITPKNKNK